MIEIVCMVVELRRNNGMTRAQDGQSLSETTTKCPMSAPKFDTPKEDRDVSSIKSVRVNGNRRNKFFLVVVIKFLCVFVDNIMTNKVIHRLHSKRPDN